MSVPLGPQEAHGLFVDENQRANADSIPDPATVALSEDAANHKNQAIACLLHKYGRINADP